MNLPIVRCEKYLVQMKREEVAFFSILIIRLIQNDIFEQH